MNSFEQLLTVVVKQLTSFKVQHSTKLGKTFPVGWVGGWLGGWVAGWGKAGNKANLSQLELELG